MTAGGVSSPATPRRPADDRHPDLAGSRRSPPTRSAPAATRLWAGRCGAAVVGGSCAVVSSPHRRVSTQPDHGTISVRPGAPPNLEPIHPAESAPRRAGRTSQSAMPAGDDPTRFAAIPASCGAVVTSEGRRHAGSVSGYHDSDRRDRPTEVSADRFAGDLPALRAAVWTMPDSAVRLLRNQLRARAAGGGADDVDVMILLAEACLRRRDVTGAVRAAGHAVRAAEDLDPVDARRRLCAYGVAADITLYACQPAVADYNDYLHELTTIGDWAGDALRTVYARAGHAVATWREKSREHGLQLLTDLCEWSRAQQGRHHAVTVALAEALTAMRLGCSACGPRTASREAFRDAVVPAPLPGGILQPDLTEPDRAFLASRVHDCPRGPR